MIKLEPLTLTGEQIRLEPMSKLHLGQLAQIAMDASIWEFAPEQVNDREKMERYVEQALKEQAEGKSLPFVTRIRTSGEVVGSTRFGNIDVPNRKVEIGWTWITPSWQRSFVNSEAKLLMLGHAFEVWNCIRVEFKTDATNHRSRNAILRLGAVEEGTLRQHMITESGRFRDSVYFSILDKEWGPLKSRLQGANEEVSMRTFLALITAFLMSLSIGCHSSESDRPVANRGKDTRSTAENVNSNAIESAANAADAPAQQNSIPDNANANLRNKKLKDIRPGGIDPTAPKPDVEAVLKNSERPAPEDSLFAVALVDNVVERRIFLKHPVLAKVEKVTVADGSSSLKVVTRDGKTYELPGNAVGPLSTAASWTIMRAIGLEGPAGDRKQRPGAPTNKN